MTAIEILVKEHDSILQMIEITQTILNKNDETKVNLQHVEEIIDFVQNFADKYHHLKEEDVLFMELEKHGMKVNTLTPAEKAEFVKATQKVYTEFENTVKDGKELGQK